MFMGGRMALINQEIALQRTQAGTSRAKGWEEGLGDLVGGSGLGQDLGCDLSPGPAGS